MLALVTGLKSAKIKRDKLQKETADLSSLCAAEAARVSEYDNKIAELSTSYVKDGDELKSAINQVYKEIRSEKNEIILDTNRLTALLNEKEKAEKKIY